MQGTGWKRVGQIYQAVAIVVLNTLIVIVLGIFVAHLLLPTGDDPGTLERLNQGELVPVGVNVTYSDRFNRNAYYLSSGEAVEAMLQEYDAMSRAGHWMVHPWTGLTMRPFRGMYLNIDENGLRVGTAPVGDDDGKTPLVVWAFGGSTLFGWGVADGFSIPALLQTELQQRLPERQVEVINFAVPIYNSSQELALFAANLRADKPDIAFFFDGVNDLWYTMNANTQTALVDPLASVWEAHTYTITHPTEGNWVTVNPSFPPLQLARMLGLNLGGNSIPSAPRYAMQGVYAADRAALLQTAVDHYRRNRQMASALGEAIGVETFFFLQPYLKDTTDFPLFRAALEADEAEQFYDLSRIFDTADMGGREALIDDFHYSDYAAQLIAEQIANILLDGQRES